MSGRRATAAGSASAAMPAVSRAILAGLPGLGVGASSRWMRVMAAGPPAGSAAERGLGGGRGVGGGAVPGGGEGDEGCCEVGSLVAAGGVVVGSHLGEDGDLLISLG